MLFKLPKRGHIGGLFIAGGSLCLAIALIAALYSWHFVRSSTHVSGRILRMIEQKDKDEGTVYFPVFTFADAQGTMHTIHSSSGSFPPDYEVGDSVSVLYRPNDPENAKIDSFFSVWGISLVTGIIGGIYLPAGLIVRFWPAIVGNCRRKLPVASLCL